MCIIGIINANAQKQQSLVTNDMAQKIAWTSQYGKRDFRSHMYGDFCKANEITSSLEYDRIMEDITKHKDKVENFICAVLYSWGVGDWGYAYFKNMDFTVKEYDVAVKIFNQWDEKQKARRAEEEQKVKQEKVAVDKDTLALWHQRGIPTFDITHTNVIAPTFTIDIEGYGSGQIIEPAMQKKPEKTKQRFGKVTVYEEADEEVYDDRWLYGSYRCESIVTKDRTFHFIVDEKRKDLKHHTQLISIGHDSIWRVDLDSTGYLFEQIQNVYIDIPAKYIFEGLDSSISVPTNNTLRGVERRNKIHWKDKATDNAFAKFEILVEKDKKTKQWSIKTSDEEKMRRWFAGLNAPTRIDMRTMTWFIGVENADEFINSVREEISSIMRDNENKKCKLTIRILGCGEKSYYINGYKAEDTNWVPFKLEVENNEIIK